MNNQLHTKIVLLVLSVFVLSCGNDKAVPVKVKPKDLSDKMEYANKHLVKVENEEIENYIERYSWNMKKTATGLRYFIYKEGYGEKAKVGDLVTIKFSVELINGIKCYSSEEDGPKEFVLGKDDEINGLHEGVLRMKLGDKAKLIVPSHLAFGLLGDQEKIPLRASLVYDIELIKIITNKIN